MYKVGVVTVSDSGARGDRKDLSGGVIREIIEKAGGVVSHYRIIPDDREVISSALTDLADIHGVDIILTTGGTGFSPRDVTPEATEAVIEKKIPGIPEAMRLGSFKKTPRAILSRATAGIRGKTAIINLPGSPRAVRECLELVVDLFPHIVEVLRGETGDCARDQKN